ncbi:TRAP transporter substrate-binding protein [Ancylobacter sp. MQZ15Z-1]|uniref:TRAP transporter substrate-binding protein n=1 Tax=Ancylobacter mangrovi TaxID=2972472 RepID=A0A9X2PG33_9HYPH|nr:TRAP transporter substrate-binding protein [Ancylobacter mangrovi]MCS0497275.1 TRAP transporter substrate-binding protein [Ancylobacter mangrovi]
MERGPSRRTCLVGMAAGVLSMPYISRAHAAAPIQLKFATADTQQDKSYLVGERFGAEIAEKTGGKYKVQMYVGGALGSTVNIGSSLQTGIVDCAILTSGYIESLVPTVQVIDLPFIFKDEASAAKILDGEVGQKLLADMAPKGIVGLSWGWYGWRQLELHDRVVKTPDDMHGLKIRIQPGPVFAAMFKQLGAIPIVLDGSEVYLALSQSTVGAVDFPVPTAVTFKVYEVTKNLALTRHVYNAGALMVSKALWGRLSPAERDIFKAAAVNVQPFWRQAVADATTDGMKFLTDHGMQATETDFAAFRAKMDPVYAQFRPKYQELFDKIMAQQ